MSAAIRIAIEARLLDPAGAGGVAQSIVGLASALSTLTDGDEEYIFVSFDDTSGWLRPHIAGPCRLHAVPWSVPSRVKRWKQHFGASSWGPPVRNLIHSLRPPRSTNAVPSSDGTVEGLDADFVHFASQGAYLTELPSLYQPYDLQHKHLPHFFPPRDREWRDFAFPLFCQRANLIAVESSWAKDDFVNHYGLSGEKVLVIPIPPLLSFYGEASVADRKSLAERVSFQKFLFYPAQTWPHKNHIALLEALAKLRDTGLVVPLVCSGRLNGFYREIRAKVGSFGLSNQVCFLGYVSEGKIRALYDMCRAVVMPTRFEAASIPIWEAFEAGKPVVSSNVTCLPRQVGDAGLLFDPDDIDGMALAIRRLWEDQALCDELARRGHARIQLFSWQESAKKFRAAYRFALEKGLTEEDRAILNAPPLL